MRIGELWVLFGGKPRFARLRGRRLSDFFDHEKIPFASVRGVAQTGPMRCIAALIAGADGADDAWALVVFSPAVAMR